MSTHVDQLLDELVKRLHDSLDDDLVSVVLYGSAASGDYQPEFSDLNVLCVLRVVGVAELRRVGKAVEWWNAQKQTTPLILSLEEAQNAADAFPIEFEDISHSRRLLHGKDMFAAIAINPQHHRRQVEHELRTMLLRMRSRYLTTLGNEDEVVRMMARSASSFATLTRHALILYGETVGTQKREILKAATARFGLNPLPYETLLAVREGTQQIVGESVHSLFSAYLEQITRLAQAVDKLGKMS